MDHSHPSRQPLMRTVVRTIAIRELLIAALVWAGVLSALAFGQPMRNDQRPPLAPANDQVPLQEEARRHAVWNSPAMLSARAWLAEYFRTSKASPPEVEAAYTKRLSELSSEQMLRWLNQMSRMRGNLIQLHQQEEDIRRLGLTRAMSQRYLALPHPGVRNRPASAAPVPSNYVELQPNRRDYSTAYRQLYEQPSYSFRLLHYLDTLDIRDDLRALRASGR